MAAGRGLEGSGARGTRGGCHEADGRVGEAGPLWSAALGWGEKSGLKNGKKLLGRVLRGCTG